MQNNASNNEFEKNDNGTITRYIIDPYNLTGYAQAVEEWSAGEPDPDRVYAIGDDVLSEAEDWDNLKLYLCAGQGSVRHHANNSSDPSIHKYLYCPANPVNGVDPMDLLFMDFLSWNNSQQGNLTSCYHLNKP